MRSIHRRRPLLTALVFLAALAHSLATRSAPADLLDAAGSWRSAVAWGLMVFGVAVRLWGSGNLSKNQEITTSGAYALVRHPLYLGSLSLFLAYFLTVGDPVIGIASFAVLVALVYYPTMLSEEANLRDAFPADFDRLEAPPRLLPDPRRLPLALRTDRFSAAAAYRNLGFRSAWILVILPLFLWFIGHVQRALG